MKLIDGNRLKKHLDYLIKKDTQFAKMCEGNDDFNRQRKYSFGHCLAEQEFESKRAELEIDEDEWDKLFKEDLK